MASNRERSQGSSGTAVPAEEEEEEEEEVYDASHIACMVCGVQCLLQLENWNRGFEPQSMYAFMSPLS
jgi:hypothetical protein